MIKTELKAKLIASMDQYNLLAHPAGNRIKSTTEFNHLCCDMNLADIDDCIQAHNACYYLMIKPGLFRRYPEPPQCNDLEQHDNYIAISCMFRDYSQDILKYGLKHLFYYNDGNAKTLKDHISCIRQPYQMMIFTMNAGFLWTLLSLVTGLGIIGLIQLWGAIILSAWKEGTSSKLLIWAFDHSRKYQTFGFLVAIPFMIWSWKLKKIYGDNYTEKLFAIYYGPGTGMEDLAKFAEGL